MVLYALILSALLVRDSIKIELVLPDTVRAREAVPITLRVVNSSSKSAILYTQGRPTVFDIVVSRSDGTPVWHRLNHAVVTSILQMRKLGPGEVLEFTDSWNQRDDNEQVVPPGKYRVTGVLPTESPGKLQSPTAQLSITP